MASCPRSPEGLTRGIIGVVGLLHTTEVFGSHSTVFGHKTETIIRWTLIILLLFFFLLAAITPRDGKLPSAGPPPWLRFGGLLVFRRSLGAVEHLETGEHNPELCITWSHANTCYRTFTTRFNWGWWNLISIWVIRYIEMHTLNRWRRKGQNDYCEKNMNE